MRIFIDADAFPNIIKDILMRAAARLKVPLVFVANKPVRIAGAADVSVILVSPGRDVADDRIAELARPGDLVVPADIPLADRVVTRGAFALNPRGKLYTAENIKDCLATRGLMNELRESGMITGGPATFNKKDRQAFANQLDSFLIRQLKTENSSVK